MIRKPTAKTLAKYGLDEVLWALMVARQKGVCALCLTGPKPPRFMLVVDHEHRKGWAKMPPEQRRLYLRGLVHPHCNHRLLGRWVTAPMSRRVAEYLDAYEDRKRKETT